MTLTTIEPGVCIALDVPDLRSARRVLKELTGVVRLFKVGLELFCAEGPKTVEAVRKTGAECFLDLKVHDIPRTAAAAVREAAKLGASLLTIHGQGGREMIRAAVEASAEQGGPRLLTVTVLTSLGDDDLPIVGVAGTARAQALRIGELAAEEGTYGLVLSPRELEVMRVAFPDVLLVTPGVRPEGTAVDDHRRAMTPTQAIVAGADLVVVGRPILQASDRAAAAAALIEEVLQAEAQRETRRKRDVDGSIEDAEQAEYVQEEP